MANILVLYGSYRSDRLGIRLADYAVTALKARGDDAELVDAKAVGLPMLDRMYKEHAPGTAPSAMETLARRIKAADASSTLAVGGIGDALDANGEPQGSGGAALVKSFPRLADDLSWWTEAALAQRARRAPPY